MAFKYGGEVMTMSMLASSKGNLRASAHLTEATAFDARLKGAAASTRSTAGRNTSSGRTACRASTRCGLLCEMSIARETLACFEMIIREKAVHSIDRTA